jgi:hypothetical protein
VGARLTPMQYALLRELATGARVDWHGVPGLRQRAMKKILVAGFAKVERDQLVLTESGRVRAGQNNGGF